MELTYCMNAFFFLKLVLSIGLASMKTLINMINSELTENTGLLFVDEVLVGSRWIFLACSAGLRAERAGAHHHQLLVDER